MFKHNRPFDQILEATKRDEGCKIRGEFHLHFISNNFYVGYGNARLTSKLAMKNEAMKMSLEHKIHKLTFGPS